MRTRNNRALYESIMRKVGRVVKQALNEGTPLTQRPYVQEDDVLVKNNKSRQDRAKQIKMDKCLTFVQTQVIPYLQKKINELNLNIPITIDEEWPDCADGMFGHIVEFNLSNVSKPIYRAFDRLANEDEDDTYFAIGDCMWLGENIFLADFLIADSQEVWEDSLNRLKKLFDRF